MNGLKNINERLEQSVRVLKTVKMLGIDFEYDGLKQFSKVLNLYVKLGESSSGKIFVKEECLYIHYILTVNKKNDCQVVLSNSPKRRF
jgi:hypothetical protein